MAQHTITLSDDQEAALAVQLARNNEPGLTADGLLQRMVDSFSTPLVQAYLQAQASGVHDAFLATDAATRSKVIAILTPAPTPTVTAV